MPPRWMAEMTGIQRLGVGPFAVGETAILMLR
jgi:hypothetical protein